MLDRYDAYCFALHRTFRTEVDGAGDLGEQGMILAHADIIAGMDLRAALADNDTTGRDQLAAVALYPQSFGIRITTISGTATCFFMCHGKLSLCRNAGDLDFSIILPMSLMFLIMFPPPHLKNTHLVMSTLVQYGRLNRGTA